MTVIVEFWWYTVRVVVFVSGVIGLVSFYINTLIIVIHGFGNLENVYINTCCPMFTLSKCTKAARHNNTFNVIRLTCFESIALEVTVILRWCCCKPHNDQYTSKPTWFQHDCVHRQIKVILWSRFSRVNIAKLVHVLSPPCLNSFKSNNPFGITIGQSRQNDHFQITYKFGHPSGRYSDPCHHVHRVTH